MSRTFSIDESSGSDYRREREQTLSRLHRELYPVHVQRSTLRSFIDQYSPQVKEGEELTSEVVTIEGRIQSKREMGKLTFLTVAQGEDKLQVKIKADFVV